MKKENSRIIAGLVFGIFLVAALFFVSAKNKSLSPANRVDADSGHRLVMGTFARIVVVAPDKAIADRCIEAGFVEIENVDRLMSDYKTDSEISIVNRDGFKRAVEISEPTYQVLQKSLEFSRLTNGAFDITVGPLVDLFRRAEKNQVKPTAEQIAKAKLKVGFEKLTLDPLKRTVKFAADGMRLDLGGIAKGYSIDKAVEAMQANGAIGGMVDIGGDIRCFGAASAGKDHWLIGLQDPGKTEDIPATAQTLLILELTDAAVATSGDYRRFALIDGEKYSHIVDTKTGGSSGEFSSVTIISKNATDADAIATAVSVMGAEKGFDLVKTIPETEAILIGSRKDSKLIKTDGAEKYIK